MIKVLNYSIFLVKSIKKLNILLLADNKKYALSFQFSITKLIILQVRKYNYDYMHELYLILGYYASNKASSVLCNTHHMTV